MGRRPALFTEPDLRRAIKVVRDMGILDQVRVVITADGSIAVEPISDTPEFPDVRPMPGEKQQLRLVPEGEIAL